MIRLIALVVAVPEEVEKHRTPGEEEEREEEEAKYGGGHSGEYW